MDQQHGLGESVKKSIIGTVRGTGEIVNAVTETVAGTLVGALRGVGNVGQALTGAVSDVARGVIHGTHEVGGDLAGAAKGAERQEGAAVRRSRLCAGVGRARPRWQRRGPARQSRGRTAVPGRLRCGPGAAVN